MCINLEYDQALLVSSQYQQSTQACNGHPLIQPQAPDLYHKLPSESTFKPLGTSQAAPCRHLDTPGLLNTFDASMNVNPTTVNYHTSHLCPHQGSSKTPQAVIQSTPTRQVDKKTSWEYLQDSSISHTPPLSSAEAPTSLRHIGSPPPELRPNLDDEPRQNHGSLQDQNCDMDGVRNYFYGDSLAASLVNDIQESSEYWYNDSGGVARST